MATANGNVQHVQPDSPDTTPVIGKRKRSASPEKVIGDTTIEPEIDGSSDQEQFERDLSSLLKLVEE